VCDVGDWFNPGDKYLTVNVLCHKNSIGHTDLVVRPRHQNVTAVQEGLSDDVLDVDIVDQRRTLQGMDSVRTNYTIVY